MYSHDDTTATAYERGRQDTLTDLRRRILERQALLREAGGSIALGTAVMLELVLGMIEDVAQRCDNPPIE